MKSYTDIEQSRKLAEILPIESADMCYPLPYEEGDKPLLEQGGFCSTPCWSLAALLGVLPNKIVSRETAFEGEDAKGINDIYYKCIESTEDDRYMCRYVGNGYKYECVADNPINACYEMILELHEQNLI